MRSTTRLTCLIAGCWLALLVAAATDSASQTSGPEPTTRALVAADNEFGFNLFGQLQRQDEKKNIFFSPLSIATALGMTYNGAAGETGRAMAETLKLAGMSLAEVNQGNAALLAGLKGADPNVELAIANSLWARQGVEFKAEFLTRNRQFYGAAVAALDFRSPMATSTINSWVNSNTKGKIPRIIAEIDAQTVMLLLNAVYFKGRWQTKFDKARTKDESFQRRGDRSCGSHVGRHDHDLGEAAAGALHVRRRPPVLDGYPRRAHRRDPVHGRGGGARVDEGPGSDRCR